MNLETIIYLVGVVLTVGAAAGLAFVGVGELRVRALRRGRLAGAGATAPGRPSEPLVEKSGGLFSGQILSTVRRLGQQSAVRDPAKVSLLRSRLMQAGFHSREAPVIFLGVKAAALAVATVGVVMTLPMMMNGKGGNIGALVLAVTVAGAALMGPEYVLKARRSTREREYSEGFPDLLDLLVASVEAGLSLDAAVSRVTEELERRYPNLTIHLRFLVLELRAGRARKDAWTAFADRLGIDDARALATMLRQAEDMGTSLGDTLSVFSADMRMKRMMRAEEKALGLSAKLTVPLILFIFPSLLGALMLPAVVRVMAVMAKN
ncbi:MAG: type II secretion system F family protein [Alphaproteobacteria bacterium]|nr:type II secretion system F family protein [Alphaproteobacteria bacterium]MBU1515074.1 type II secretion system F family protein [Alphaproteobacteria bacterium]MBU2093432.1 type II secretion system F family protein [Alphaproteobacteria bacterium]MBU2149753.1 type II secretion system F family protein [Alphaproteobacteria bacterium]MBU2308094.1 type II secretion system F family protein [Alphaproteobacteria bacterium]